jgi:hypothetical protein
MMPEQSSFETREERAPQDEVGHSFDHAIQFFSQWSFSIASLRSQ